MIGLKLIGTALLAFAGVWAGVTAWRFQGKCLLVLDKWIDLIRYIRTQIDCFLSPINDIMAGADQDLFPVRAESGATLPDLLERSTPYLDAESRRLITSFVREIGGGYREEQLHRMDYYLASLQRVREKNSTEFPARARVSLAISVCTAVGAAIVLW